MKSMFGVGLAHTVRRGLLLLLVGWSVAGVAASIQRESGDLTKTTLKPSKRAAPREALPGRFRSIEVNAKVLDQAVFDVTLFPGETLRLERDRITQLPNGDQVWSGRIAGEPLSRATFAVRRGVVSGVIDRALDTGNELYEISPSGAGGYQIFQHNEAKGSAMGHMSLPAPIPLGRQAAPATLQPPPGGVHIIDLMVVYTPATRARYGRAGIEAKILQAVADANTAMANSQAAVQFSLVHMTEVAYVESGSMTATLTALQRTTDGLMDEVHALRDQYGADLVNLVSEDTSSCGLSYVMSVPSPGFAGNAFSVVYSGCLASLSMVHELGHQLGCQHDRGNSAGPAAYPYAYGWRQCSTNSTQFRTIMSYACGSAIRVNYFSNPNLLYAGQPLGVDAALDPVNAADNARAINLTAGVVAGFRAPADLSVPEAPTGLTAVATSYSSVTVSWTDAASNELCQGLERSADGASWTLVATLTSDITSFVDNSVAPATSYVYRIRASNSVGSSGYSNEAPVSVPAIPAVPAAPTGLLAALASGQVVLSWQDASSNETQFRLERSVNGGAFLLLATVPPNTTSFVDATAVGGSTCAYRVAAVNEVGSSPPSATSSVAVPAPLPASASGLTAVHGANGVTLRWADNASNESSYRVERSVNGGAFLLWIVLPANSVTYVDSAVSMGSNYRYRVVAANTAGYAPASNIASVTVPGTAPAAPSSLAGVAASRTEIRLSWIDNASTETGFAIERSTNGSTWTQIGTVGVNVRSYASGGLKANTTYYYRVRAFNSWGNSAYTSTVSVKTLR